MTLETLLEEAANSGRFCLTLWPTDTGYQANFSRDRNSWSIAMDVDPATAIAKVLGAKPEPAPDLGLFD